MVFAGSARCTAYLTSNGDPPRFPDFVLNDAPVSVN
jgi:hypothetical protein